MGLCACTRVEEIGEGFWVGGGARSMSMLMGGLF